MLRLSRNIPAEISPDIISPREKTKYPEDTVSRRIPFTRTPYPD
jgi:hypothetical protein